MEYSVIIPCFNYGQHLPQSIVSALTQTIPPNEIIIVDDGSTDSTPSIMAGYAHLRQIKYIQTANRGVSAARNTALAHCRNELIALLDADDFWYPQKMERQFALLTDPRVGVIYTLRQPFNEKGTLPGYRHVQAFRGDVLVPLMSHNLVCASSALLKKSCLEKTGGFDESLTQGEDYDLWLRLAASGYHFEFVDKPLVAYRMGGLASNPLQHDKRFSDNTRMFQRLFRDPRFSSRLTPDMKRRAFAGLWSKRSYNLFGRSRRVSAFVYGAAALTLAPDTALAWRMVIKCLLPGTTISRRAGGISPYPATEGDPRQATSEDAHSDTAAPPVDDESRTGHGPDAPRC